MRSFLFCRCRICFAEFGSTREQEIGESRRNQKCNELIGNMGTNSKRLIYRELAFHEGHNPNKIKESAKFS